MSRVIVDVIKKLYMLTSLDHILIIPLKCGLLIKLI